MKITDLTITVFTWDGLVPLRYSTHVRSSGDSCQLALLQVFTDQGPIGRSFIGSPVAPAEFGVQRLGDILKPIVMGQNPLERERLFRRMWGRVGAASGRRTGERRVGKEC